MFEKTHNFYRIFTMISTPYIKVKPECDNVYAFCTSNFRRKKNDVKRPPCGRQGKTSKAIAPFFFGPEK